MAPSSSKSKKQSRDPDFGIPWKKVSVPRGEAFAWDASVGGIMGIEEVDGVDVKWDEDAETGAKNAKLVPVDVRQSKDKSLEYHKQSTSKNSKLPNKISEKKRKRGSDEQREQKETGGRSGGEDATHDESSEKVSKSKPSNKRGQKKSGKRGEAKGGQKQAGSSEQNGTVVNTPIEDTALPTLPNWPHSTNTTIFPPSLLRSLHSLNFDKPTPVQIKVLETILSTGTEETGKGKEKGKGKEHDRLPQLEKDIVATAPTGSGKTLAYSLPILYHLLANSDHEDDVSSPSTEVRGLTALVLTPTRELALQVTKHVQRFLDGAGLGLGEEKNEGKDKDGGMRAVCLTGGMSIQKQRRVIERALLKEFKKGKGKGKTSSSGGGIVVATPGRLWEMIGESSEFASLVRKTRFLVLDEADKMVESGRFEDLEGVFAMLRRKGHGGNEFEDDFQMKDLDDDHEREEENEDLNPEDNSDESPDGDELTFDDEEDAKFMKGNREDQEEDDDDSEEEGEDIDEDDVLDLVVDDQSDDENGKHYDDDDEEPLEELRTLVFSATMSKNLQLDLKKKKKRRRGDGSTLDDLLSRLDFRDDDPVIVDLTPGRHPPANGEGDNKATHQTPGLLGGSVVETLKECKVECLVKEKDLFLYYFLIRYPGRTLCFLGAIDGIRRLNPILNNLGLNVISLHSGMQQRARLKALDKFRSSSTCVLLATDVAARGLDIPSVDHVVHYQIPRSADSYIHRSGRTARAGKEGVALALCGPEEKQAIKKVWRALGRDIEIPDLSVDFSILNKMRERLDLSKAIDTAEHRVNKESHEKNWLRQAAEAMDVEIDEDMSGLSDDDDNRPSSKKGANNSNNNSSKSSKSKKSSQEVNRLKAQLRDLLSKPLTIRGVSMKYLTSGSRQGFVNQLLTNQSHEALLGLSKSTALDDMKLSSNSHSQSKKRKR